MQVPTVDPVTGKRDPTLEPLSTLRAHRTAHYTHLAPSDALYKPEVMFSVDLKLTSAPGRTITVGDLVRVDEWRLPPPRLVA
jgi:hypothetical protein